MHKEELSIKRSNYDATFNIKGNLPSLTSVLERTTIARKISLLYTKIVGEKITSQQTVYFFYAQVTCLVALLPFEMNYGWRTLFLITGIRTLIQALKPFNK